MIQIGWTMTLLLLVVCVLLVALLVTRRVVIAREDRRSRELFEQLQPLVIEWLGDPDQPPPPGLLGAMDSDQRDVVSRLLSRYGSILSGEARERITAYVADQGFVEAAVEELGSIRSWRRGRAARALGDFGSARAVRYLSLVVLNDRDSGVRLAATRALGRIDDYKSAAALLIVLPTGRVPAGVIAQSLLDLGLHAFHAVVSACDDEDLITRRIACRILGLIGSGSAPDGMRAAHGVLHRRAADDADPVVRAAALGSLARLGDTTSDEVVRGALSAPDRGVRRAAADAALGLYLRELAPDLLTALAQEFAEPHPNWRLVRSAATAWAELADQLDVTLLDEGVRQQALPFLREAAATAERSLSA